MMMVSDRLRHPSRLQSPAAVTRHTAGACRPIRPHLRRSVVSFSSLNPPRRSNEPQEQQSRPTRLPQLVAGCGAAVVGLLGPLLPSWALDSFALDSFATDTSIDPGLGDSPPLLDTLLVVVITYFTVMLLYLWLSSFMEGDDASSTQDSSQAPPGDDSSAPPGYGTFLDAHVRTYVGPGSKQVTALKDLGQAEPLEGEDMAHLKNRLAAGAAEALELQLRDCERLIRSKLLARKLGYAPQQHNPADGSNGSSSRSAQERDRQIEEMMLAAVMTAPEGLGSWQHRAAVEALIEQQLNQLLPPGGGKFQEDLVVRQVMRRVVQALVMEESLLLLEGTDKATRLMQQQEGKGRKRQPSKPWALW